MTTTMQTFKYPVGPAVLEAIVGGSGDTVVLLPGNGGDVVRFTDITRLLNAEGFRTVAINPRGVAGSTGPLEGLTLHDLASDVAGVITALAAAPAHVLGTSFGNRVARCVAADHPQLVRTVILVAAGGMVKPSSEASMALRRWRENPTEEAALHYAEYALAPKSPRDIYRNSRMWGAAGQAQSAANSSTPIEQWWMAGQAPVLIIQGLEDQLAPPENGRLLKKQLGDRARLVEIADAGHAALVEQPQAVADAVLKFLREH